MTQWTLEGRGRLAWQDARALLAGHTCVWLGLYDLHIGPPPEQAPIATTVWGWNDRQYIRARLDEEHVYVGILRPGPGGEPVAVAVQAAIIGRADGHGLPPMELLDADGTTFLRAAR